MSFYHHILKDARALAPHLPLGLTAEGDIDRYEMHRSIALAANVDFVSYDVGNLETQFVTEFLATGRPLISWTVCSKMQAEYSAQYAAQPTFEGFLP